MREKITIYDQWMQMVIVFDNVKGNYYGFQIKQVKRL